MLTSLVSSLCPLFLLQDLMDETTYNLLVIVSWAPLGYVSQMFLAFEEYCQIEAKHI